MDMDMDMSISMATATATATSTAMSIATSTTMSMTTSMTMSYTFTTAFPTTPLLFPHLVPTTSASLFGIWLLIFSAAILYRGLTFLKMRLEATVWAPRKVGYVQPFSITRDGGRGALELVTAIVGYGLMLVVMTFVVVYFFAVVVGLAVGEMVFRRLEAGLEAGRQRGHH